MSLGLKEDVLTKRIQLISKEKKGWIGGKLTLSPKEQAVNEILMKFKAEEIEDARKPGAKFPPAVHFFHSKELIEKSNVFKMIKSMPKGAALHLHDVAMVDVWWVIENFTYLPHLYGSHSDKHYPLFRFFDTPPKDSSGNSKWKLISDVRKNYSCNEHFDKYLYSTMTMVTDDPYNKYPDGHTTWEYFMALLNAMFGLFHYTGVFSKYYYQCLQEFYDDNVQYLEMRTILAKLYELDGTQHEISKTVEVYHQVALQFAEDHSDWSGTKLIISDLRGNLAPEDLKTKMIEAAKYRKKYPDYIAGYDLCGPEASGRPLKDFLDVFKYVSNMEPPMDLPYMFHAGETNWNGTDVDENLFDALLLNTTRIGHGYAILNHPEAMKVAIEKDIPLEINPISNQVLGLVKDLRNHPASVLMAQGFPMVISSDDPGFWGARGISYDYYMAFMGFGGAWANLATLKQLFLDSLKYSAMTEAERGKAVMIWQEKWDEFINKTLEEYK